MLDNLKLITYNQTIIQRLAEMQSFERYQHRNNNFVGFCKYRKLMRLDFRKSFEKGILVGFHHLEISISPHYHFNHYLHNGNDFTPKDCIKTVPDILTYLGIEPHEYDLLKVVNIEFGLNIIPEMNIKNLINGLLFYKKASFKVGAFPYFKKTDATSYKQIKAYAKGLQFLESSQFGINPNTFRFEVKSKQAKNIKKYGIANANDLIKPDIYKTLTQQLLNEWENVLLINQTHDFSNLKPDEVQFIQSANKINFWNDLIEQKHRNTFSINKEKYHKITGIKNNLHHLIKLQIIDKLFSFQKCANSTQKTLTNRTKVCAEKILPNRINLEYAHFNNENRVCLVTGLDISMQRKRSKYLSFAGLKFYREKEIDKYNDLENKYLTDKMRLRNVKEQLYYIAHNIRNAKTNLKHNRKSFEQRNYPKNQLQFNFQF